MRLFSSFEALRHRPLLRKSRVRCDIQAKYVRVRAGTGLRVSMDVGSSGSLVCSVGVRAVLRLVCKVTKHISAHHAAAPAVPVGMARLLLDPNPDSKTELGSGSGQTSYCNTNSVPERTRQHDESFRACRRESKLCSVATHQAGQHTLSSRNFLTSFLHVFMLASVRKSDRTCAARSP